MSNDTPSLAKVIKDALEARLADLHTCLPATVESYDAATGLASVAPSLKRKYASGDVVDLPVIPNVPVVMPRGGGAAVLLDLQPGDPVLLVFAERSVDGWKTTGGKVDPKDPRKHSLSDAFAIPGGYPKAATPPTVKVALTATGVTVTTPGGELVLEAGALSYTSPVGELLDVVGQLFDAIKAATTTTMLGPQPLVMPTFDLIKAKFDTFKG